MKLKFNDKKNWLVFLLAACAVCQFFILQYFNFFEADIHMGVDATWEYLKAMVIGKNGGFYPTNLLNSTTAPSNDKVFLLVAPLYRLFKNVWVAFGLTNMIILIASIAIMWVSLSDLHIGLIEKLIVVNLFICPYLMNGYVIQNDLGYFSCAFGLVAYYNMMILEFLMLIRVLLLKDAPKASKKTLIWVIVSLVFMCFTGVSDGPVMIVMALVPAIAFVFVRLFIENNWKTLLEWKSLYLYGAFGAVALGCVFGKLAGLPYEESTRLLTTAAELWTNVGHLICGYMLLLGAIPGTGMAKTPFSIMGIGSLLGLVIFVVVVIAVFFWLIRIIKSVIQKRPVNNLILFLECVIWVDFLEFTIVSTSYGEDIFEKRYLIISMVAAFILVGCFIKELADTLIFKWFGIICLFAAIVGADLVSDYLFKIDDNLCWRVDELQEIVTSTDAGLVYTWGKELTPIERCMRVLDDSRVYKAMTADFILENFGDYTYYDDSTKYEGPTVLVVTTDAPGAPQEIIDQYELLEKTETLSIYYSKDNPIDIQHWTE